MENKTNNKMSSFDDIIKYLKDKQKNFDKEIDVMMTEIAVMGENYLKAQYSSSVGKDYNILDLRARKEKMAHGYKLIGYGADVIYEEFGTGDEGETHPHPVKENYSLNDYNSGSYIRDVSSVSPYSYTAEDLKTIGIDSGKFWYYEKGGMGHYTQGVPAGQEMWDTRNYLIKEAIPMVLEKHGVKKNGYIIESTQG